MSKPPCLVGCSPAVAILAVLLWAAPSEAAAQSVLERPPNLQGTWVGRSGTVHFNFMHRFVSSGPPARKIIQTPTFLLGASLPHDLLVGANYSTNSAVVAQVPNEWEFFARYAALAESDGGPVDLAVQGGYNQAALSWDGQLALGKRLGAVRLLGAGRFFSNAFDAGDARFGLAGGASVRLSEFAAIAGDYGSLLDRTESEGDPAWSVGLQLAIPYTPHTFSIHASNTRSRTLEGASIGEDDVRYGFEFTVPLTLSRYFGSDSDAAAQPAPGEPGSGGEAVTEVGMNNQLRFLPDTVRIAAGETIRWRNTSDVLHTVTADPGLAADASNVTLPQGASTFDSGNIAPGEIFEYTFSVPGTYQYICVPHELVGMIGWVIVSESKTDGDNGPDS